MPLIKSPTKEAREENIREMIHAHHPPAQAVAAAYRVQREAEKKPQRLHSEQENA
jgi:hypothetical protein